MRKYKVRFAYGMCETVEAKSKQEAKEKYIDSMAKVIAEYGWDFDEECKKSVVVKYIK